MPILQRQSRWLAGIFLVLAFLGHDALMATSAHAALAPAAHEHAAPHQPTASPDDEQHPTHPSTCGVAGVAVPSPVYQLDFVDLFVLEAIAAPDLRAMARLSIQRWEEPFWPPGTFRALLQVYRI